MQDIIDQAIAQRKYVNVHRVKSYMKGYNCITGSRNPTKIEFDASVCRQVFQWNEEVCDGSSKGEIWLYRFPNGYMPTIHIDRDEYAFNAPPSMDRGKDKHVLVVADSYALFKAWSWYSIHKDDLPPSNVIRDVYHWDPDYGSWRHRGVYRDSNINSIVGLQDAYDHIMKDVTMLLNRKDIIGALDIAPSCNYLLESRPGMGKTSLIRALCTKLNVSMHVITADTMKKSNPERIFSTTIDRNHSPSIYLFEDFDRYLDGSKEEQMASILNAMDGVADMPISIRFFTANTSIEGPKMEAFLSRIRRRIALKEHVVQAYERSINIVFPSMDQTSKDTIRNLFHENNITMRVANHILCSVMVDLEPLECIIKAVGDRNITCPRKILSRVINESDDDY